MTTYMYNELGYDKPLEMTEDEILLNYYPSWCSKMKALGRDTLISKERCIEDWVTVHWAWKKQDD